MVYLLMITVFGNLIMMTLKNCRSVLGVAVPAIILSLSLLIMLAAKFSFVAFIIAIYINLLVLIFSVFVTVRVSQQKAKGKTDDFIEYWEDEDNKHKHVRIRVFTSRGTKMVVWQRDKGKCTECGSNQDLEFRYIVPYSKGGSNTYKNIHLVCQNCNLFSTKIIPENT